VNTDPDHDAASWRAARDLAPAPVAAIEPAGSGANSHVYRLRCDDADFALKQYPTPARDLRDRLGVEWRALTFLAENGVDAVARPIARSRTSGFVLMEWLAGTPVARHGPDDLRQAIAFMSRVFDLSRRPEALSFPPAAEACLSASAIVAQIEQRRAAFARDAGLDRFLGERFQSVYRDARDSALGSEWAGALPSARRRLIPADFGFHNALRGTDGRLRYFDFDYFGWDDPVKLAADFILHPAMSLTPDEDALVARALAAALPDDRLFLPRLDALLPLHALRWSLILLNPFRADRKPAGPTDDEKVLSRQLAKARRMTARASSFLGGRFALE